MKREIKQKLLKHINFLENELGYYPKFRQLTETEPLFKDFLEKVKDYLNKITEESEAQ